MKKTKSNIINMRISFAFYFRICCGIRDFDLKLLDRILGKKNIRTVRKMDLKNIEVCE
jgi:hypothetical protein